LHVIIFRYGYFLHLFSIIYIQVDSSFGINYIASLENGRILLLPNLLRLII
jgi:hypothetical protein